MGGCAATTQPIQRGWDIWHADLAGTGSTDTIFMLTLAFFLKRLYADVSVVQTT